jgi:uncharacterized lipoprotein NlpE involved in copper resistance
MKKLILAVTLVVTSFTLAGCGHSSEKVKAECVNLVQNILVDQGKSEYWKLGAVLVNDDNIAIVQIVGVSDPTVSSQGYCGLSGEAVLYDPNLFTLKALLGK